MLETLHFFRRFGRFMLAGWFLTSCLGDPERPQGVLDAEEMKPLLKEFHLLEAQVARMSFQNQDSAKVAFQYLEKKIFKKYGIDSATYARSYQFYGENPAVFLRIYQEVAKELEATKDSVYRLKTKKP